ncbi:MAG TPA: hypothetical protein PLN52_14640 [Opitutaceae bacterium]|nr:hypothetical protein [Opitutaceae bacterium]
MMHRVLTFLVGTAAFAPLGGLSQGGPSLTTNAPVKEFSLPSFNEEGFRTMLVRGREAVLLNRNEVRLSDMTLTQFSGDEKAHVEAVFLSPLANLEIDRKRLSGPDSVRVITDQFELFGSDWSYDHAKKTILIQKKVQVIFRAELKNVLK